MGFLSRFILVNLGKLSKKNEMFDWEKHARVYETPFGTQYAEHGGKIYYRKKGEMMFSESCISADEFPRFIEGGLFKFVYSNNIFIKQ